MKKPLKIILIILAVLVGLVAALLIWLTATQLNVKTETAVVTNGENSTASFAPGDSVSILTWNVGYAGLGEESDFFMDGGKQVRAPSKAIVEKNMDGIVSTVKELDADFTFLQEIEADPSTRSYGIEEAERMRTETGLDTAHARNYKCAFVPYPIPPIGKVSSGIMTLSTAPIASAERIALPSPFKWPVSVANLKRCLMPVYIDLEGTDAQLVLVNLHLEAYDDGEGKAAQTAALKSFLEQEYAKGNYVIAGGDFNQTFPGGLDKYPIKNADLWTPGTLDDSMLPDGWHFAYDTATPTCRLDNQPYDAESDATQHYVIDGFILSPNVELTGVQTQDDGFRFSDHNPVLLNIRLKYSISKSPLPTGSGLIFYFARVMCSSRQEFGPKSASIPFRYAWKASRGMSACTHPAKPPPCTRHAPTPSSSAAARASPRSSRSSPPGARMLRSSCSDERPEAFIRRRYVSASRCTSASRMSGTRAFSSKKCAARSSARPGCRWA